MDMEKEPYTIFGIKPTVKCAFCTYFKILIPIDKEDVFNTVISLINKSTSVKLICSQQIIQDINGKNKTFKYIAPLLTETSVIKKAGMNKCEYGDFEEEHLEQIRELEKEAKDEVKLI